MPKLYQTSVRHTTGIPTSSATCLGTTCYCLKYAGMYERLGGRQQQGVQTLSCLYPFHMYYQGYQQVCERRLTHWVHTGVYERLMLAGGSDKELEIVRDLSRTYPSHVYYQQRQGPGQRSLFNVLRAYSIYDRQVLTAASSSTSNLSLIVGSKQSPCIV